MTREQNFQTSFAVQLASYSGWQYLPQYDVKKLPLAAFPAFSLSPGKTKYTTFDPTGKAITGEQDFTITISYLLPHVGDDALRVHSDITNLLEQFINNPAYLPPTVAPGDACIITRCMLVESKAPVLKYDATRFQVTINAKYLFTIF
jgi:hypothetical protein